MVMLAQASPPPPPPLRIAASSFASVEVHLNARRIGNRWFEEDASLSGPSRIAISDRKSTRLNSSHSQISYAVFCLKKKKIQLFIIHIHVFLPGQSIIR